MINRDIQISTIRKQYITEDESPLNVFMVVEGECYPTYPYNFLKVDSLKDFNTFNRTPSYNIAEKILDGGCKLFVTGLNNFENRTTLRIHNNGSVGYPLFGKEYVHVPSANEGDPNGVYYLKFDLSGKLQFTSSDLIVVSSLGLWYVVWFGTEEDHYPPVPDISFTYDLKISSEISLENQLQLISTYLSSKAGYMVTYTSEYLLLRKYTKFQQSQLSTIPIVDDENVYNDTICSINENFKVIDFWSNYNSRIRDIKLIINKYYDDYRILVYRINGTSYLLTEEFQVNLDPASDIFIDTVLEKSEVIRCRLYRSDYDISGEYLLGRTECEVDTSPTLWIDRINELEFDNDNYPDVVIDSGIFTNDYIQCLIDKFGQKSIILTLNSTKTLATLASFPTYITEEGIQYPGYIESLRLANAGIFEGPLLDTYYNIQNLTSGKYINQVINDNYGLEYVALQSTTGISLKALFGIYRSLNFILRVMKQLESRFELETLIEYYSYLFDRFSGGSLSSISIESFTINQRSINCTLNFNLIDKLITNYLVELEFSIRS